MALTTLITSLLARMEVKDGVKCAEVVRLLEVFTTQIQFSTLTRRSVNRELPSPWMSLALSASSDADRYMLVIGGQCECVSVMISTHREQG